VPLVGVSHVMGDVPHGGWRGPWNKLKMYVHIARAWMLAWQDLRQDGRQSVPGEQGYTWVRTLLKRVRLAVVLVLTLGVGAANSCSGAVTYANRLFIRSPYDEMLLQIWGQLKAAISLLQ
jgi:hypothetical protein